MKLIISETCSLFFFVGIWPPSFISNIREAVSKIHRERNRTDFADFKDGGFSVEKRRSCCVKRTYIKFATEGK